MLVTNSSCFLESKEEESARGIKGTLSDRKQARRDNLFSKCICKNFQMHLSKLPNVIIQYMQHKFVQI